MTGEDEADDDDVDGGGGGAAAAAGAAFRFLLVALAFLAIRAASQPTNSNGKYYVVDRPPQQKQPQPIPAA